MNDTLDVEIRALAPELLNDYLTFFDHDAFADNPRWASCYCRFPHAPHDVKPWKDCTGEENRAAVSELIIRGEMHGYLAYHEGRAVAWCNAGPRSIYTTLPFERDPTVGAITCFVVAPGYRGKGVARQLLDAACEGLRARGFATVEGYPTKDTQDAGANHYGPFEMFMDAGFTVAQEQDNRAIVRKALG